MAGRFSYSGAGGRLQDRWFRIGTLDVGSAGLLASACAVVMFIGVFLPSILAPLALNPYYVRQGQVWRIVTWPLAATVGFWPVIAIVLVWYVGTQLEVQTGKIPMAVLLSALVVGVGLVGTVVDVGTAGVEPIEFVIILLYIAEYPRRPFFFGIPAWILGAFFVAVRILSLIQQRQERELLLFLATMVIGALGGRAVGLLGEYPFLPKIPIPVSMGGTRKRKVTRKAGGAPQRNHRGQVVSGPWAAPALPDDRVADQAEMDALLDKISADGLDSLSKQEKQRLNELSKKLR